MAASAVQPPKRLYYLDWLRVFIIGGVFLAHTVLPFTGGDWFASLINDQPVSNVACARGSSLTCP